MPTIDELEDELAGELYSNARDFLNLGLSFLLGTSPSPRDAKFAVVNIQMSIELLIKRHLLFASGLQAIFNSSLPGITTLRQELWNGTLLTKNYNNLKAAFIALEGKSQIEQDALDKFQSYRNRIVHSFMTVDYAEAVVTAAELVFRTMRQALGTEPDIPFKAFIEEENYKKLVTFRPYIALSMDEAERLSEEDVKTCWECCNLTIAAIEGD